MITNNTDPIVMHAEAIWINGGDLPNCDFALCDEFVIISSKRENNPPTMISKRLIDRIEGVTLPDASETPGNAPFVNLLDHIKNQNKY